MGIQTNCIQTLKTLNEREFPLFLLLLLASELCFHCYWMMLNLEFMANINIGWVFDNRHIRRQQTNCTLYLFKRFGKKWLSGMRIYEKINRKFHFTDRLFVLFFPILCCYFSFHSLNLSNVRIVSRFSTMWCHLIIGQFFNLCRPQMEVSFQLEEKEDKRVVGWFSSSWTWIVIIYWINGWLAGWSDKLRIVDCIVNTFHNHTHTPITTVDVLRADDCYDRFCMEIICGSSTIWLYTQKFIYSTLGIDHKRSSFAGRFYVHESSLLQMQNDSFAFFCLSIFFFFFFSSLECLRAIYYYCSSLFALCSSSNVRATSNNIILDLKWGFAWKCFFRLHFAQFWMESDIKMRIKNGKKNSEKGSNRKNHHRTTDNNVGTGCWII